jgi:hypothetical protein
MDAGKFRSTPFGFSVNRTPVHGIKSMETLKGMLWRFPDSGVRGDSRSIRKSDNAGAVVGL